MTKYTINFSEIFFNFKSEPKQDKTTYLKDIIY